MWRELFVEIAACCLRKPISAKQVFWNGRVCKQRPPQDSERIMASSEEIGLQL